MEQPTSDFKRDCGSNPIVFMALVEILKGYYKERATDEQIAARAERVTRRWRRERRGHRGVAAAGFQAGGSSPACQTSDRGIRFSNDAQRLAG